MCGCEPAAIGSRSRARLPETERERKLFGAVKRFDFCIKQSAPRGEFSAFALFIGVPDLVFNY